MLTAFDFEEEDLHLSPFLNIFIPIPHNSQ